MEKVYTCKEVAEKYRVSEFTIREWIKSGKLKAVRTGEKGRYRIKQEHLDEFEKSCEQ